MGYSKEVLDAVKMILEFKTLSQAAKTQIKTKFGLSSKKSLGPEGSWVVGEYFHEFKSLPNSPARLNELKGEGESSWLLDEDNFVDENEIEDVEKFLISIDKGFYKEDILETRSEETFKWFDDQGNFVEFTWWHS